MRRPGARRERMVENKENRRMKPAIQAALALLVLASAAPARADGDPAAGKVVFAKCAICHTTDPAKKGIGPTLFGVVGRKSASVEGFSYSEAMKKADKTWDPATLDAYLTNPKAMVPGTKMIFPGLPKAEDRANVIAYLATLK
jgi:cytochrome c